MATLSAVLGNYNHARFLRRSVDAILGQSRKPDEILIFDDASTDGSREILADYAARYPDLIRLTQRKTNLGILQYMNEGLRQATGEYILFCSADDWIFPTLVERSMALLEQHPSAGLCSSLGRICDDDGRDLGAEPGAIPALSVGYFGPDDCRKWLADLDGWILGGTAIYKRQLLLDLSAYEPKLASFTDNFYARLVAARYGVCFMPEPQVSVRRATSSYSTAQSRDPEKMATIRRTAIEIMRRDHAEILPPNYLNIFDRRFRYMAKSSAIHWSAVELAQRARLASGTSHGFLLPELFRAIYLISKVALFLSLRLDDAFSVLAQTFRHRQVSRMFPPGSFDRPV